MFGWLTGNGATSEDPAKSEKPGFHPVELPASPRRPADGVGPSSPPPLSSSSAAQDDAPLPATSVSGVAAGALPTSASGGGTLFGDMALSSGAGRRRRTHNIQSVLATSDTAEASPPAPPASAADEPKPFFANAALTLDLNEADKESAPSDSTTQLRQRLEVFFHEYCPSKLPLVDQLAEEFHDEPDSLMQRLVAKHGPEPPLLQSGDLARGGEAQGSHSSAAPTESVDREASTDRPPASVSGASAFSFVSKTAGQPEKRDVAQVATEELSSSTAGLKPLNPSSPLVPSTPSDGLPHVQRETSPTTAQAAVASSSNVAAAATVSSPVPEAAAAPTEATIRRGLETGKKTLLDAQNEVAHQVRNVLEILDTCKTATALHDDKEREVQACVKSEDYEGADAAHSEAETALETLKASLIALVPIVSDSFSQEKSLLRAGAASCIASLRQYETDLLAVQSDTIKSLEQRIAEGERAMDNKMQDHAGALQEAHTALEESTVAKQRVKQEASALKRSFTSTTAAVTARMESLTEECDALQNQIRSLESQLDALRADYDGRSQALSKATSEYESLQDEYDDQLKALAGELAAEDERQASAVDTQQLLTQASAVLEEERLTWEARKAELLRSVATCKGGAATACEQRSYLEQTQGPLFESLLTDLASLLQGHFDGHGVLYTVPICLVGDAACRALLERPSPLSRQVTLNRDYMLAVDKLNMTKQLVSSLTARTTELRTRVPVLQAEKEASVANKAFREAKEKSEEIHRVQSTITAGEEELADLTSRMKKEEQRAEHISTSLKQEKALSRGRVLSFLSTHQQTLRKVDGTIAKLRSHCTADAPCSELTAPELVDAATEMLSRFTQEAKLAEETCRKSSAHDDKADL